MLPNLIAAVQLIFIAAVAGHKIREADPEEKYVTLRRACPWIDGPCPPTVH